MGAESEALGILELPVGHSIITGKDLVYEIKPRIGDNRKFRKEVLMNEKFGRDKSLMFDAFEKYIHDLIKRDYPSEPEENINEYTEFELMTLFDFIMIKFRWTTQEKLDESKKQVTEETKKQLGVI